MRRLVLTVVTLCAFSFSLCLAAAQQDTNPPSPPQEQPKQTDKDKEKQEISLIGRIFSLDVLLILMGLFSLLGGLIYAQTAKIFWGGMIIGAALLLNFVRKRILKGKGWGDGRK